MTWPTLPPFSANNFVDHFDAGSLDATKWTAVTSGTGSVALSDSNAVIDSAAANQAAFIYANAQLDLTKSQLWMVCLSFPAALAGGQVDQAIKVLNGASTPAAAAKATVDARTVLQGAVQTGQTAGSVLSGGYFSSAGTQTWWPAPSGPFAVFSAASGLIEPIQTNDYYVFGLEIDGVNQRWRMMGWGQAFAAAGTYTFNQGWRLFALTDWVTWANTRVQTGGLWLAIGHLFTDTASRSQTSVEWVRYAEAPAGNTVIDGWCNALASNSGTAQIKHSTSYDGQIWIPQDRTTAALTAGGASPDNSGVAQCSVAYDGSSTDWMFYQGSSGANTFICAASASHVAAGTGQNGTWTKSPSNPLLSQGTAGAFDDGQLGFPIIVVDQTEPDLNKAWKMLYAGLHTADSKHRCMYATAPGPTGPWTKQGVVIDVGGTGADDSANIWPGCVVVHQGVWYVLYEGKDAAGLDHLMWATGSSLATLAKQGTLYTPDNVSQSLTANLNTAPGRTVTVASTAGYRKDASVVFSQSSSSDTYSTSKIRKIVDATTLELYHGVTGFLTATPAKVRQTTSSPNFTPRWCALGADGNWWFDLNFWEPFNNSGDGASYNATPYEEGYLAKHSASSPVGAAPVIQDLPYVTSRGFQSGVTGDSESFENLALLFPPVSISATSLARFLPRSLGPKAAGPTFFAALQPQQQGTPAQPGVLGAPAYLPRRLGPKAAGPQFFAALQPQPAGAVLGLWLAPGRFPAQRNRVFASVRGRRTVVVAAQEAPVLAQRPAPIPRVLHALVARGRRTLPTPPQVNPPYPWPNRMSPARSKHAMLRKGSRSWPVAPQLNPPYPWAVRQAPGRRLAAPSRPHRWLAAPAQADVWPLRSPAGRRLTAPARGRQAGPVPTQPVVLVSWPPPKLGAPVRMAMLRKGSRTLPVASQQNPPYVRPGTVHPAAKLTALRRGSRSWPTPPQQNPPFVRTNRQPAGRRYFTVQRGHGVSAAWFVLPSAAPKPPCITPPTSATITAYSAGASAKNYTSAAAIVAYTSGAAVVIYTSTVSIGPRFCP